VTVEQLALDCEPAWMALEVSGERAPGALLLLREAGRRALNHHRRARS
jgi:hypothetical protein